MFKVNFGLAKNVTIVISCSITNQTWKGQIPYKAESPERKWCIDAAFLQADVLGFDAAGAQNGEIVGGLHNHTPGGLGPKWIMLKYTTKDGKVVWHKKKDGKWWDRIHLWDDPKLNLSENEKPVEFKLVDDVD